MCLASWRSYRYISSDRPNEVVCPNSPNQDNCPNRMIVRITLAVRLLVSLVRIRAWLRISSSRPDHQVRPIVRIAPRVRIRFGSQNHYAESDCPVQLACPIEGCNGEVLGDVRCALLPGCPIQNGVCARGLKRMSESIWQIFAGPRRTQYCPHQSGSLAVPESNSCPNRKKPECQNQGACPIVRIKVARISPNHYQGPRLSVT